LIWHRLRQLCPDWIKVLFRRGRSRLIDPFDRGVQVEICGTWVRVPGYFTGRGRADYELASAERFKGWLSAHPAGLVVDVGCSVSVYGVIALSASPEVTVVAIDPDFSSLVWSRFICSKVKMPQRLRLVHGFVVSTPSKPQDIGAASAEAAAEFLRRSGNPFAEITKYQDGSDPENRSVPRHSLDALLAGERAPGGLLIKIDVEGNELGVLQGSTHLIGRVRPVFLLSVHPVFGVDVAQIRGFFEAAGYSTEHFATDHEEHWWCAPGPARVR
jgi:FkbM family methyltransferase